jgi:hypothetical protein
MTNKKIEEKLLALERWLCNCCKVLPTTNGIPTIPPTNGQTVKIDLSTGIIYYYDSDTSTWEPTPTGGGGGFFTSSVNAPAGAVIQDGNSGNYTIDNLDQLNVNAGVGGQIILTTEGISGDSSVGAVDGNAYLAYEGSGNRATVIATEDYVLLLSTNGNLHLSDGGTLYSNPPSDDTLDSIVVLDPSDGKVYLRDAATIGGGGAAYVEVTYAAAEALVAGSTLIPGTLYKITDRGDRGIFLNAISVNQFALEGQRLMLVPTTYETTGIWLGIWRAGLLPSIGDLVIWDAHVYENNTGAVGTAPDGDAVNWTIVPKTSFSNGEYTEFVFGVVYDISEDWISEQWDDSGNRIIIDKALNVLDFDGLSTNEYVDQTDWNYLGHQSDDGTNVFSNNTCYGWIKNNIQADGSFCNIYSNINAGGIENNRSSFINNNENDGAISNNTCQQIADNTNKGDISVNSNTGGIFSNNNDRGITDNSNGGDIIFNYCIGLRDNSNGGDIGYNNISGNITDNAHDGPIEYNRNNGNIENCTGSGGFSVHHNTNNGNIDNPAGLAAADITDVIVNK